MENVFDFPIFADAKAAFSSGIATIGAFHRKLLI
jgi:hypothetical protein